MIGTSDCGKECKFIFCCRLKGQGVTEAEKLLKLKLLSYNRRDWNSGGGNGYVTQYGVVMEGKNFAGHVLKGIEGRLKQLT